MKRIVLIVLLTLGLVSYARAQTLYSYRFEGSDPAILNPANLAFQTATPAAILQEAGGNHYLRMYTGATDCGPTFDTTCPTVRSEMLIGTMSWQTVSIVTASLRYRTSSTSTSDNDRVTLQFFQYGGCDNCTVGYANTGWTMKFTGVDTLPASGYTARGKTGATLMTRPTLALGTLSTNVWHTLRFIYTFSHSDNGTIRVSVDGVDKGTITTRTVLNQLTGQSTSTSVGGIEPVYFYLNIYDDGSLVPETLDFDDIIIQQGLPAAPPIFSNMFIPATVVGAAQ